MQALQQRCVLLFALLQNAATPHRFCALKLLANGFALERATFACRPCLGIAHSILPSVFISVLFIFLTVRDPPGKSCALLCYPTTSRELTPSTHVAPSSWRSWRSLRMSTAMFRWRQHACACDVHFLGPRHDLQTQQRRNNVRCVRHSDSRRSKRHNRAKHNTHCDKFDRTHEENNTDLLRGEAFLFQVVWNRLPLAHRGHSGFFPKLHLEIPNPGQKRLFHTLAYPITTSLYRFGVIFSYAFHVSCVLVRSYRASSNSTRDLKLIVSDQFFNSRCGTHNMSDVSRASMALVVGFLVWETQMARLRSGLKTISRFLEFSFLSGDSRQSVMCLSVDNPVNQHGKTQGRIRMWYGQKETRL
jgi:hypothetical protein